MQYRVVSSAYVAGVTPSGRTSVASFAYTRKRVGPRMLPCGTPAETGNGAEVAPRTTACIFRLVR